MKDIIRKRYYPEKIDDLHKIAKALLTYETLTERKLKISLIRTSIQKVRKIFANDEDNKDSALGSIGLKPKIVY